jgi:hypothetical protein
MYAGWHQANHWAITYRGGWELVVQPEATFEEAIRSRQAGDTATFTFEGSHLSIAVVGTGGRIQAQIDQNEAKEIDLGSDAHQVIPLASDLPPGQHLAIIEVVAGPVSIDGFIVENRSNLMLNRAGSAIMVLATLVGLWVIWKSRREDKTPRSITPP